MHPYTKFQDTALLVLRLIIAAIFFYAGSAKWVLWSAPPDGMSAGMVFLMKFLSIVEPPGAVALVAGFLTRWAATGLAIIMAGSLYFVRFVMKAGFFTTPQGTGLDYNVLILGGCITLMAFGAGRFSVDALWKKA